MVEEAVTSFTVSLGMIAPAPVRENHGWGDILRILLRVCTLNRRKLRDIDMIDCGIEEVVIP